MQLPQAVFATLTPKGQKEVLDQITPIYKKLYTHHVTLVYGPSEADMDKLSQIVKDGQYVTIVLGRRYWSNGVEAVEAKVTTLDGKEVPIKNVKPHVTISTSNKPPVLSNDMLAQKGEFAKGFDGVENLGGEYEARVEFVEKF